MNPRHALLSLLLLLLAPSVWAAYQELAHQDMHEGGTNFTVDENSFEVITTADPDTVLLRVNGKPVTVLTGTCEDTQNMSICLKNVTYVPGLHRQYVPSDFSFDLEIYYDLADLVINRQISADTLLIGKVGKINTVITNSGSVRAKDIVFMDPFPDFNIIFVSGCTLRGSTVSWRGSLGLNKQKKCTYSLTPKAPTIFSSVATATYDAGQKQRTASSDAVTITVPELPLMLMLNMTKQSTGIGEENNITLFLENTNSEPLAASPVTIKLPPSLKVVSAHRELRPTPQGYTWSGTLQAGEQRQFSLLTQSLRSGVAKISAEAQFQENGFQRQSTAQTFLEITTDQLVIQYITYNQSVQSGDTARFSMTLANPSQTQMFRNIKVNVSTDLPLPTEPRVVEQLLPRQFTQLVDEEYVPEVTEPTNYTWQFEVSYETEFGEQLSLREAKGFTALPGPEAPSAEELPAKINGIVKSLKEDVTEMKPGTMIFLLILILAIVVIGLSIFVLSRAKKTKEQKKEEKIMEELEE